MRQRKRHHEYSDSQQKAIRIVEKILLDEFAAGNGFLFYKLFSIEPYWLKRQKFWNNFNKKFMMKQPRVTLKINVGEYLKKYLTKIWRKNNIC